MARAAAQQLAAARADVVFSPGTIPLAYLETEVPTAFWTDATFARLVDYYPEFTRLEARSVRAGHAMEREALGRCSAAIYSSDWAARSAVEDYGADPSKVHVVPFGANVDGPSDEAVTAAVAARPTGACQMLFIGADWERKGGPVAVAAARRLNHQGLPTELTVIGQRPPGPMPDFVRLLGFQDKGTPAGVSRIEHALMNAHVLVLPTRAEAFGIVFCEAFAYGVPVVASSTGGVPSAVRDGRTGILLPPDAGPDEYAAAITGVVEDHDRYGRLATAAREEYRDRLNWDVSARRVLRLLENGRV